MSDFFSNCLAAMATLLKKQKPIAFKMAMIDKMIGEGKDGGDNDDCNFVLYVDVDVVADVC